MIPLLTLLACGDAPPPERSAAGPALTIAYSHNVDGEIEPCG